MSDDVRSALAQALEAALRDALRGQTDPGAYLDGIRADVLPSLLGGQRQEGALLRDPDHAAVVAGIFAEVVLKLREEWRR
ncbi:hypothetical protein [Falsiroseomonas sp.]|jgi:hypothetical protein|uniref:hypothetical protein n=1 Tax=Falsiroseomonas sp. TaxID=2870721 RepID=UPI003F70DA76